MRTKKKELRPAYEAEVVDKTVCDMCSRQTKGDSWEQSTWYINYTNIGLAITTEISAERRKSYGWDGGEGEKVVVDLCPWCFKDKLIPWLRSQGVKVEIQEIDW